MYMYIYTDVYMHIYLHIYVSLSARAAASENAAKVRLFLSIFRLRPLNICVCLSVCLCRRPVPPPPQRTPQARSEHAVRYWRVDVRLPGKGHSNSHGARPVHQIITMIKWFWTCRLSIKNSLSAILAIQERSRPIPSINRRARCPRYMLLAHSTWCPLHRKPSPCGRGKFTIP